MATQIQMRRGTAAQWVAANPTLSEGEQGVELDTGRSKIGNGTAAWNALAYPVISPTDLAYTASAVGGTLTSSTGSDTVIPLAGGGSAGLMTAAEKTKLANTSGSNSGDQDLSGKQDVLVSASNIKTINGASIMGGGDMVLGKLIRVGSTASSAAPSINTDNCDIYKLTAQAVDITSFTMSGAPTDGQVLIIEITGTAARSIAWGASFEASTVTLPTTTVATAMLCVGFIFNGVTAKWRCVGAA